MRSADLLGTLCPDAGRMNHMPGHIYVLCGEYEKAKTASEKAARANDHIDRNAQSREPIFMSINFMKVHQPNMPHPDYVHKSMSKSKYADSVVELDARIGCIMDKVRALGLASNTLVFYTTDNGAWQDVYPDAGYTPFRGTQGHPA
jgi:arylsulfatase A-like enzyme